MAERSCSVAYDGVLVRAARSPGPKDPPWVMPDPAENEIFRGQPAEGSYMRYTTCPADAVSDAPKP